MAGVRQAVVERVMAMVVVEVEDYLALDLDNL